MLKRDERGCYYNAPDPEGDEEGPITMDTITGLYSNAVEPEVKPERVLSMKPMAVYARKKAEEKRLAKEK